MPFGVRTCPKCNETYYACPECHMNFDTKKALKDHVKNDEC